MQLIVSNFNYVFNRQKKAQQDAADTNNDADEEPDFLSLDDDLEGNT